MAILGLVFVAGHLGLFYLFNDQSNYNRLLCLYSKCLYLMKVARIYLRVSTDQQDLTRQREIIEGAKQEGYYIAAVYSETASGARADRPELLRMIDDLGF